MSVSLSNESKNSYDLTNESKDNDLTWDEATMIWDDANGTWDSPGRPMAREAKNSASSFTNESKL